MSETMITLDLSTPLRTAVARKFDSAARSKNLIFSPTEVTKLRSRSGVTFQLRYCPNLRKKPVPDDTQITKDASKPKFNPFENPSPELYVAAVPASKPSHNIVLNKFPIIENHFILATIPNKPQTALLESNDLGVAHACIKAWNEQQSDKVQSHKLLLFFNSGEESGASQPHRHLQFVPVEAILSDASPGWTPLIEDMTTRVDPALPLLYNPDVPYLHFAIRLQEGSTEKDLYDKYTMLLRAAYCGIERPDQSMVFDPDLPLEVHERVRFSYNMAMTENLMAICPRRSETASIPGSARQESVSINGTILGGTLMVKEEQDWDILRENPEYIDDILTTIGFPVRHVPV